ncbi:MAG: Gfo/Idh/MocA family oxidoreductase [bacterium]|nr:Gfo/Idh/MocA family oxidoreductase [bacterium]
MKLGIVGTGQIVKEFLPYLTDYLTTETSITCHALCGTLRSKETINALCNQYDIKEAYSDYEQFLRSQVDIVYIAIPNHLHFEFCIKAMKANKHVIVEKPMTSTYEEASLLASYAKEHKLFFYEAISTRYLPNYKKIKELLPLLGEIKMIECNFSQYSSRYDAFLAGSVAPVFDPRKSGGTLIDLNLYNLHYIIGLLGEPNAYVYQPNLDRGIDTSGVLTMDYGHCKAVSIAAKDCFAPNHYVISGTNGYITQDTPANSCGAVTYKANKKEALTYDENHCKHRMLPEFKTFFHEILTSDYTSCYNALEESLLVNKVITTARREAGIYFPADEKILSLTTICPL